MIIPEVLKKPLEFGNPSQIKALKIMAEKADFEALPKCKTCDGTGEVTSPCDSCEGEGKDAEALDAHYKRYPL